MKIRSSIRIRLRAAFDTDEDRAAARKIAQETMVLLKNDGTLPLKKTYKTIAIVGPNADSVRNMLGDYTYPAHIESLIEVKVTDNALAQPSRTMWTPIISICRT